MKTWDVLRCPQTGNRLHLDSKDFVVRVENADITYPVTDGIIDFCPQSSDAVSQAYDNCADRYDQHITCSSLRIKLWSLLVWGTVNDDGFTKAALSYLPPEFNGVLLDVPCGTGVYTGSIYRQYPDANIIVVDYSLGMLQIAMRRFEKMGLKNVTLVRANVSSLPLANDSVNLVLSMNGLHVFPDKNRATNELKRVLQKNCMLIACGYIMGQRKISDWFVNAFGVRKGYLSPPFYTLENLPDQYKGLEITDRGNVKSGVYFQARKK